MPFGNHFIDISSTCKLLSINRWEVVYRYRWNLLEDTHGNVLIEILKDGAIIREFLFPAYKQYNLQAHFEDIVEGEIKESSRGYEMAASTGLHTPVITLEQLTPKV